MGESRISHTSENISSMKYKIESLTEKKFGACLSKLIAGDTAFKTGTLL